MTIALLLGVAVGVVFCINDWRRGLLLTLAAGFLQDPLRKIVPGRPAALVVLVAVFFLTCLVGASVRGQRLNVKQLTRWYPTLAPALGFFFAVVVFQSAATLLRFQNVTLAGLGLLGYLSPLVALVFFFQVNRNWSFALKWIRFYLLCAAVMAVTVILQFIGYSPTIFDSIGLDTVYGAGGRIAMLCGIMRSSEITAFHAGVGACLALMLATAHHSRRARLLYGSLIPFFLLAIVLSGRRKMLAQFAMYLATFLFLMARSRKTSPRVISIASTAVFTAALFMAPVVLLSGGETLSPYLTRSTSVFGEAWQRLQAMTVGTMETVVSITGVFGAGAGTTAQGSQYFGGADLIVAAPAEGGLGKVLAELGLPGLLVLAWLGLEMMRALAFTTRSARQLPASQAAIVFGLVAFVPTHAIVFATAHQVYGDPFVLIVLGSLIGFALSARRIQAVEAARAAASASEEAVRLDAGAPERPSSKAKTLRPLPAPRGIAGSRSR